MKDEERLRAELSKGRISEIYSNTYYSLVDRIDEDGCIPESVGVYGYGPVEYCRTVGAVQALFQLTGEYALIEKTIKFALDSAIRSGLNRIPHIAHALEKNEKGEITQQLHTIDQADGTFHVINAWGRFVLSGKCSKALEDDYYEFVKKIVNIHFEQPYFYYDSVLDNNPIFPPAGIKLVFNCAFEHSRDGRYWSTFDLLTQSFAGAMLTTMISVAESRGDDESAANWQKKLKLLITGIEKHMTREIEGKKVYLEMRVPDGGWGRPHRGMGWVNLSPIAAGWEPLEAEVLENTVEYIRHKLWGKAPFTDNKYYMPLEFDEKEEVENLGILGKEIGWDIAYSLRKYDYAHILEWIDFLSETNTTKLFAECLTPIEGKWQSNDPGNGEQCAWWCWAMALLRASLGMSAAPERI